MDLSELVRINVLMKIKVRLPARKGAIKVYQKIASIIVSR